MKSVCRLSIPNLGKTEEVSYKSWFRQSAPPMFVMGEFKHGEQISHIIRHIVIDIGSIAIHTQKFAPVLTFQLSCFRFHYRHKKPGWVRR